MRPMSNVAQVNPIAPTLERLLAPAPRRVADPSGLPRLGAAVRALIDRAFVTGTVVLYAGLVGAVGYTLHLALTV